MYEGFALLSIQLSLGSFAYIFGCGFTIDNVRVDYGTPMYGQEWCGFATKDRVVIRENMSINDTLQCFTHEVFHNKRIQDGTWDNNNKMNEEIMAYEYAANSSNWDNRITRYSCVEE